METKKIKAPEEELRDEFDGLSREAATSDFKPGKLSSRSQIILTFKLVASGVLLVGLLWALDQYLSA